MIQTIKQNKKAVLAFLLALVMLIRIIPFTATQVQAVTIPVGDITTNNSFGTGAEWEDSDELYLCRVSKDNQWEEYTLTANVADGATTWTPSEKLYWDGKDEHKLIVSYPANHDIGWDDFAIPSDQSTLEALKSADCMNAMWKGDPTTEPVNFELKHRMSMVTVTYTLASEFESDTEITPEVYSNAKYIIFFDSDNLPMNTSVDLYDTWVKAYKHNEVDDEGNITAKKFTAIVSPDVYSAGDEFIRITIGDQVLTAKMPNDITFQEGTHYTFDLKVGKDKVTIKQVSVNGNDPSVPFGDGWRSDTEEDLGAVSITDTQDEGKTAWYDGDQIIATLTSQYYGKQTAMLTFSGSDGTWSTDESFSYLENETPTVKAVYAPSNILGTGEYIEFDCELNGEKLTVKLESATRNYSRLRIVGLPNQTLTVTTTEFTPAGATSAATDSYTLTTDENGNAFLYGTFAENATIVIKQGNVVLKEYAFHAEKFPGGTEQGKSYVLGAMPVIDGTLGGKTEATEKEVNALVEQLKTYVDNGITTIIVTGSKPAMIDMGSYSATAIGEAIYRLSGSNVYDENNPYNGKIDLILSDVTEIVEWEFYAAFALNSITLPKVTTIGDQAFQGCDYLKRITFGSIVTSIVQENGVTFVVGDKVGGCDLVLNCGQVEAEDTYKPDLENNVWFKPSWGGNVTWKSITLTHTGECDECKAQ